MDRLVDARRIESRTARDAQPAVETPISQEGERFEELREILARLERGYREDVILPRRGRGVRRELAVEPGVDHGDPLGRDVQLVLDVTCRCLGDREDSVGSFDVRAHQAFVVPSDLAARGLGPLQEE